MMKNAALVLLSVGITAGLGCGNPDSQGEDSAQAGASEKEPPVLDEETVRPAVLHVLRSRGSLERAPGTFAPLGETPRAPFPGPGGGPYASPYYTFTIGNGISGADLDLVQVPGGYGPDVDFTAAGNAFVEATYSSRFNDDAEILWVPNGAWLQSGDLSDNEQAEVHFVWDMTAGGGGFNRYWVEMEYEVSSEENYDFLWINSTSDSNCNSPGVVHERLAGQHAGKVGFEIFSHCITGWVGVYFIKDYSVSRYGDYGRIKNVKIYGRIPVGS